MAEVLINDPSTGSQAKVTSRGQLVTAPLEFSDPVQNDLTVACTAVNFFAPSSGQRLVVTAIYIGADRNVSANCGAAVEIYEATSATSTVVTKTIFKTGIIRNGNLPLLGLNFLATQGVWLNAKTDDANINITIAGYFIDA